VPLLLQQGQVTDLCPSSPESSKVNQVECSTHARIRSAARATAMSFVDGRDAGQRQLTVRTI